MNLPASSLRLFWSAVTCHRFGLRRLDAAISPIDSLSGREVATNQSGDRSPHSKIELR